MFNRWFLNESIPLELCLPYHHEKWMVLLSYVVAAYASYTALHLIARIRSAPNSRVRLAWLAIAGTAMGCGIFAMHFIAMLAMRISITVQYDVAITALSVVFAIVASGIAFHFVSSDDRSRARFAVGAITLGAGIGLMHYTGDLALQMPARIYYDPYFFGLSIVVAVALSALALYVLQTGTVRRKSLQAQVISGRAAGALVMGMAVTTMHYTGVMASYYYPEPGIYISGATFDGTIMAAAIGTATLIISGFAVVASVLDQRAAIAEEQRAQSESFLRTIINNSADAILTVDEDQIIQDCNPAAGQIFGTKAPDIIGERLDGLIEDDIVTAVTHTDPVQRREARSKRSDGQIRALEYTRNEMYFSGKRLFNYIVRDVTQRRRAEDALRASEERFRNLVVNVPGVVFQRRLAPDGKVSYPYISNQASELYGVEPEEIMADATVLSDRANLDDTGKIKQSLQHSAATLSAWDQVFRAIKSSSGEQKWIRVIAQPRRLPDGDILWDGLFIDVTNAMKQEEQNRALEAKWRQVQKMESLGTLAGGITHEFNNMLMPIMTLAEITMRGLPEDGRAHKNLATIINNCKRAAELIQKILSLSRRSDLQRTAIHLADVVAESVDLLQATTPATIMIRSNIDRSVGVILADETQILQVVLNLASNARHAMTGKVGELTIDLGTADFKSRFEGRYSSLEPGAYAKLSIKDTGCGMNETVMRRIFEPFFTTKEVGSGTGMGLAMIHSIVTGLGGAVDVTSVPGGGTTFDVYLPLLNKVESAVALSG